LDEFFQKLREIQKKERSISRLADVGDNFYKDVHSYLKKLIKEIGDNPLSFYSYLHRDARRIAAEICERREHKIIESALLNIQRSRRLFNENSSNNDSLSLLPQNMTPEEENLYYAVSKSFLRYRKEIVNPLNKVKIKKSEKKNKRSGIDQDIESYHAYEIQELEETEKPQKDKNNQIKTLVVLEELPSIVGVDRKIYGPLLPQDIVSMPEANAQIIIKNKKGRFIKKHGKIAYK
jgi:DNA replication factor GINS